MVIFSLNFLTRFSFVFSCIKFECIYIYNILSFLLCSFPPFFPSLLFNSFFSLLYLIKISILFFTKFKSFSSFLEVVKIGSFFLFFFCVIFQFSLSIFCSFLLEINITSPHFLLTAPIY